MGKILVSIRVDSKVLDEAKISLKTRTKSETVRRALEIVAEQQRFRRWVKKYAGQFKEDFTIS